MFKSLTTSLGRAFIFMAVVAFACLMPMEAQTNLSQIGKDFYAPVFQQWRGTISAGNAASGAATITISTPTVSLPDGRSFIPFSTLVRLTVEGETVTPTTVSGCVQNALQNTCQVTATFASTHGNVSVTSGSFGLDEAALAANSYGGGFVNIDSSFGGTTATITAAPWLASYPKVAVADGRGSSLSWWRAYPGPTLITTPTAPTTASNLTTAITGGTIATATTPRFTITASDFFGAETAASADTAATTALVDGAGSTNSYTLSAAAFPAGTGIVCYRLYVSASGGTTQTETLVAPAQMTFTQAPLSPLPGCIQPATAVILTALPATTAAGPPQGTSAAATALSSAHTTVVAQQVSHLPSMMPFVDQTFPGFFPVTVTSATTLAAGFDVMGELQYPAGFFNSPGSKWRICGGGVATPSAATVAGTWAIRIGPRENSAATSGEVIVVPLGMVASRQWTAALTHFDFCTDVITTTAGVSGVMEGAATSFGVAVAAGDDGAGVATTVGAFNAASTAFDLTKQGVIQLSYVQSAASWTLPQLRYFSITPL